MRLNYFHVHFAEVTRKLFIPETICGKVEQLQFNAQIAVVELVAQTERYEKRFLGWRI